MDSITVKASAKINLTLDVVGRMDNGYHLLESIFQSVGIYDFITVSKEALLLKKARNIIVKKSEEGK